MNSHYVMQNEISFAIMTKRKPCVGLTNKSKCIFFTVASTHLKYIQLMPFNSYPLTAHHNILYIFISPNSICI